MSTETAEPRKNYLKFTPADENGVVIVTLNRDDARNAFNGAAITEMKEAFAYLAAADNVTAVRVRGAGSIFCAGADLKYMSAMKQETDDVNAAASIELAHMFREIVACSRAKPMVVEVQGGAYGGASSFLGGNSYVIATEDAKMGLTEVNLGIGPFTVGPSVIHKIGPEAMSKLALSGQIIKAAKGKEFGLVNEIVATSDELDAAAQSAVTRLLADANGIEETDYSGVVIPTDAEQDATSAQYIADYPTVAPNATAVTNRAIWKMHALMQETGDPYSDAVVEYTAGEIASMRLLDEAQQAGEFFRLPKDEKKSVASTAQDPRAWMQPAPGA